MPHRHNLVFTIVPLATKWCLSISNVSWLLLCCAAAAAAAIYQPRYRLTANHIASWSSQPHVDIRPGTQYSWKQTFAKIEVSTEKVPSRRFHPGGGPSRSLHRDCEPSRIFVPALTSNVDITDWDQVLRYWLVLELLILIRTRNDKTDAIES